MNCKLIQRIGAVMAASIITICICMTLETSSVHADAITVKKYKSKISVTTIDYLVYLKMGSKAKPTHKVKVTSSKKSVAAPEIYEGNIYLNVKKAGKTTVTIRNKSTKKTYKCTLKVIKYRNPFKKFTISGKNRASKFKKYCYSDFTNKKTKSKISLKTKSGWKIKKIIYCKAVYNESKDEYVYHKKKIKNNSTIKLKKSGSEDYFQYVDCVVYNKKSGITQTFGLNF